VRCDDDDDGTAATTRIRPSGHILTGLCHAVKASPPALPFLCARRKETPLPATAEEAATLSRGFGDGYACGSFCTGIR
jgi:hypothetical protein